MSFLAPNEIDYVWIVSYVDWDDQQVIAVYTTEEAAQSARAALLARDERARTRNLIKITPCNLDPDLEPHYWWEDEKRPLYELEPD